MKYLLIIMCSMVLFMSCEEESSAREDSGPLCNVDKWGICPENQNYVRIGKIVETPTESESITIVNYDSQDYDLEDWSLWDANSLENGAGEYEFPSGTILTAGGSLTFVRSTLGFQINDSGETIVLKDNSNGEVHRRGN